MTGINNFSMLDSELHSICLSMAKPMLPKQESRSALSLPNTKVIFGKF